MSSLTSAVLAGVFALGLAGAAHAQTIPNPTNPTPAFPVATDGSPLPYRGGYGDGLLNGRSAYEPVATPFNAVVGSGLGVVDGTAGALGPR